MDYLRVPKFHLVGSAAGGGVAVDYALSHPKRLLSLVIACAVGGIEDKDYVERVESLRPKGFDDMPAAVPRAIIRLSRGESPRCRCLGRP
jgi:pimeloyl-ACP methyl ester carboxylesterase